MYGQKSSVESQLLRSLPLIQTRGRCNKITWNVVRFPLSMHNSSSIQSLRTSRLYLISINNLDNNTTTRTTTVADASNTILALLQLMQKRCYNPASRATKRMSKSNRATTRIYLFDWNIKYLLQRSMSSSSRELKHIERRVDLPAH